jgi:hypothetical protein
MTTESAQLTKAATGSLANWLVPIVSAGVAWIVGQAVVKAPALAELVATVNQEAVTNFIVGAIAAALIGAWNAWTNRKLKAGVEAAQVVLDNAVIGEVTKDGIAGPKFLQAVTDLALASLNKSTPKP